MGCHNSATNSHRAQKKYKLYNNDTFCRFYRSSSDFFDLTPHYSLRGAHGFQVGFAAFVASATHE